MSRLRIGAAPYWAFGFQWLKPQTGMNSYSTVKAIGLQNHFAPTSLSSRSQLYNFHILY